MKKILSTLLALSLILVLLASCSNQALPDKFDEEKVKTLAESTITLFNNSEYDKIRDELTREDLKAALTADVLNDAKAQIMPNAGAFVEFSGSSIVGQKDKDGNDYVVAVIAAKYENQKVTYTISFDENMKLIGFFLK